MNKPALGRGLEALMSQATSQNRLPEISNSEIIDIPLNNIFPNRLQPRKSFNDGRLAQLASSLKADGVLQPLVVIREREGYMLVAGERRWRAARLAGMTTAPVRIVPAMDDSKLLRLALVENLQREDLNAIETAQGYKQLLERFSMTQQELSQTMGKSRSAITNSLRLLGLPAEIQQFVIEEKLTEGHARALLTLSDPQEQIKFARRAMEEALTVRHVEEQVRRPKRRRLIPKHRDIDILEAENTLKRKLGAPVHIKPGLKRGKIEIEYKGVDDLNRLLELLQTVSYA